MNKLAALLRESRLARFLIPAGLILIVAGVIFFIAVNNTKDYIKTEASVTKTELEQEAYTDSDGERTEATYIVSLKYTVDGKEYEAELGGQPDRKAGDKMTIYYDPADPANITQTNSPIIPIVILALGAAALVGGIVSAVNAVKRMQKMKDQEKEWANG